MINLQFSCAALGAAGYSQASRDYISALSLFPNEVNLSVKSVNFESINTDQSLYLRKIGHLIDKPIKPDVNIVHMTPDCMPRFKVKGIPNIGYTVWETTKLPEHWVKICNEMDAIWVPSDWNVEIFKACGVRVPVTKIEHTIDINQFNSSEVWSDATFGLPQDKFLFYSIFQWNERKNPAALIKAFISEFAKKDNVALVLKAYKKDGSAADGTWIREQISAIKSSMHINDAPNVILLHKMMSREEILQLHKLGDCLVSPHRSEGWGYSMQEALASGSAVIGTGYSGNMEFMNSNNSYILNSSLTPVSGMDWPIYSGRGMWAEPDIGHLKVLMRHVCENRAEAVERAAVGKSDMARFAWKNVGKTMVNEIYSSLGRSPPNI